MPAFNKHAPGYCALLSWLFEAMEEEQEDEFRQYTYAKKAMFDAAKSGNTMILEFIFNYNPNLFMEVNSQGQNLLHIAILYRHGSVYRLISSKGAYKNILTQHVDHEGNNVLHYAGMLAAKEKSGSPVHHQFIHSEELWLKVHLDCVISMICYYNRI